MSLDLCTNLECRAHSCTPAQYRTEIEMFNYCSCVNSVPLYAVPKQFLVHKHSMFFSQSV